MPLDQGAVTPTSPAAGSEAARSSGLGKGAHIGEALRLAREARGLSLDDLAEATCVRKSYLAALETMALGQLPSRPFIIGYVRATAQALDLDPDDAVARFKLDAPSGAEPLRAPLGVTRERDPRLTLLAGGAAVVFCAIFIWNLAQRAVASRGPQAAEIPESVAAAPSAAAPRGAILLAAPTPAPQDSDLPPPYVTPGLAADLAAKAAEAAATGAAPPTPAPEVIPVVAPEDEGPLPPAPANPRAAIYGVDPGQSIVRLQARKPASIVVRAPDGRVFFARQLAAGDTYRAPNAGGLVLDVSDPKAFDVYAAGQFKGQMPATQIAIGKLIG
jgi:transcriptional regulator with XRE-family HTH domain